MQAVLGYDKLLRAFWPQAAVPKIGRVPPWPLNSYGASKVLGETLGLAFVSARALDTFIAVRLGWVRETSPPRPLAPQHYSWIADADVRSLFTACVTTPVRGFRVVYGASEFVSPLDLRLTERVLGWRPAFNAGE
jgi:hypothetical protein